MHAILSIIYLFPLYSCPLHYIITFFLRKVCVFVFQFNHNQLDHWGDVDLLQPAAGIKMVYFEANPIARDPQYWRKLN